MDEKPDRITTVPEVADYLKISKAKILLHDAERGDTPREDRPERENPGNGFISQDYLASKTSVGPVLCQQIPLLLFRLADQQISCSINYSLPGLFRKPAPLSMS